MLKFLACPSVFLRPPEQALVAGPLAVKSPDYKNALSSKLADRSFCGWQTQCTRQFHAQMLVLHALGQIDPVTAYADLRLQDMRGGGASMREVPFVLPEKQGSLVLCSGYRDPELVVRMRNAKRSRAEISE